MIIKTLVENTSISKALGSEHGLSLYIETKRHKILFDTGASALFAENAKKMKIDLSQVDIAIISHGHYDHGGGLKTFMALNQTAKIYLQKNAFSETYATRPDGKKIEIGLDKTLLPNERFVFVDDDFIIDETLTLFSGVKGTTLIPSGNQDLFVKDGDTYKPDDFSHEQNLIIKEDENTVMFAGCAHNGIVNILEHFNATKMGRPSHVIGGFHLYNRASDECEDMGMIAKIGSYLLSTGAVYYTCHCTGVQGYEKLKLIMSDYVNYLSTGSELTL